jgi:hypothetical protein
LRIPLLRFGDDDSPIAKWEVLFCPIVIPTAFCAILTGFAFWMILGPPLSLVSSSIRKSRSNKLRAKMLEAGRYLPASKFQERIDSGSGTLIVVCGSEIFYWWTEDDIVSDAPLTLPSTFDDPQSERLSAFAEHCLQTYTDTSAGNAMLCGELKWADLDEVANVITIRTWGDDPEIVGRLFLGTY